MTLPELKPLKCVIELYDSINLLVKHVYIYLNIEVIAFQLLKKKTFKWFYCLGIRDQILYTLSFISTLAKAVMLTKSFHKDWFPISWKRRHR